MPPKHPFLSAPDYVFYIQLHIEKEKSEYYDLDDRPSSLRSYNTELPKLSEILKKLIDDLQSAFDPFINEFLENDGIYCLLNLLRLCFTRQQSPGTNKTNATELANSKNKSMRNKERHHHLKRALTDEYDSLLCLHFAVKRNAKALEKMVSHKTGLSTLASCIVSNLTKSRLMALQLLTKICEQPNGVNKVLEAMSTMRIIFGESVRFKFLVSMLNSGSICSANGIELNALLLLNTLLGKTGNCAERVRLQCELEEAGLDISSLESNLIQQNISKNELIWTEIEKFKTQYLDLNDKFKHNKHSTHENSELKEEVEVLQRALNKLENDKINLMAIERQLKEKCEDLEQEVDHLKTKFNVLIPVDKKASQSRASDNGTGDSGQWSDSDMEALGIRHKNKTNPKINSKVDYNYDQNMKNEEEFIYVPAIQPPKDFAQLADREVFNEFKDQNDINDSKRHLFALNNANNERQAEDRRWRQRQRSLSIERAEAQVDCFENKKPFVVDVLPKDKSMESNGKKYSESMIGTDRENSELIWNYSVNSHKHERESENQMTRHSSSRSMLTSMSMNQINNINNNFEFEKSVYISNKSNPLIANTRNTPNTPNPRQTNYSFNNKLIPISMRHNLSQSNDSLQSTQTKKKNIKSSLQSYFFSGSSTLKQNKKDFKSIENISETPKSFPLPKNYKNNFILKGHGNCGLYSGEVNKQLEDKNLSDDLKSAPFDNISALVHKEITAAARDIGAWL